MQESSLQIGHTSTSPFDAVGAFTSHTARARFENLPAEAIAKAKTFLLDTIGGVGLATCRTFPKFQLAHM
jgi:2-methylcitrate dehydratase PrpD